MVDEAAIRECIVALLRRRGAGASICPSEVARALAPDEAEWRASMPQVRRVAVTMVEAHAIAVTQKERELPLADVLLATGPIRLCRGAAFPVES